MPADPGQIRPARIALDYFKQSDSLRRWKWLLTVAATVAALAWILSGVLLSDGGRLRYSRGPVASVHAIWDAQCENCHTPFQPIQEDSWAPPIFGEASDTNCQRCHTGPPHHEREGAKKIACASCHREHQGREASLVRLADAACVQCHADLPAHGGSARFERTITRFNLDHPEFNVDVGGPNPRLPLDQAVDPGRLKFNHERHLAKGMMLKDGEPLMTDDNGKAVQLECISCHQLDSELSGNSKPLERLPASVLPPRAAGATMLPIVYEKHCTHCHPLTFDKEAKAVPHRLQPKELHEYLERHYAGELLKGTPSLFEKKIPTRVVPGKSPSPEMEQANQRISSQVEGAERILYKGGDKKTCLECHEYDPEGKKIKPTDVPNVWLRHAYFSHLSHRAVECEACHKEARTSTDAKQILLPKIEVCKKCHAPPGRDSGGARTNCTECHRYHNGDEPLQGLGAQKRKPTEPNKIDAFLGRPRP
jgi:predicted CXXCH cytochrome family protein